MSPSTDLILRRARPVGFGSCAPDAQQDIRVTADGRIAAVAPALPPDDAAETLDLDGAFLSPGWVDLHTHIYYGATDISVRPSEIGAARGVTTLVDAGSAGEANFHGFREYIADRARERVLAFLNIGSIGLVACNRVSELIDMRSIDVDRTFDVIEANRDLIRGVKVRASGVIVGGWGITPVKIAKSVARAAKLPLMVHVGEPPPTLDEVLSVLTPGDIVTHCFNGKRTGNILEDEGLFALAARLAAEGVRLDVGHGAASFSFSVAAESICRGLLPATISTDLHQRNIAGPVWDMATTMSKLLSLGMPFEAVLDAATHGPLAALNLPTEGLLAPGARADFTAFRLAEASVTLPDSMGATTTLNRLFRPAASVIGREVVAAKSAFGLDRPALRGAAQ